MALRLPWWWWAAAVLVLAVAVEAGGGGNGDEGDGKALMAVKAGFGNAANALVDWDGRDHCAWRGVACDSASFAVVGLCVSSLGAGVLWNLHRLLLPLCICCSNSCFPPLHIYICYVSDQGRHTVKVSLSTSQARAVQRVLLALKFSVLEIFLAVHLK
jgi:hypothetical protein